MQIDAETTVVLNSSIQGHGTDLCKFLGKRQFRVYPGRFATLQGTFLEHHNKWTNARGSDHVIII